MRIDFKTSVNFGRKLSASEEAEYSDVLKRGKSRAGNKGKSILIVHSASLPQNSTNNTGVGNLGSEESHKFFEFAKKYWGINEIQLLPSGQYHPHCGGYPIYSGTSMDLGNHIINPHIFNLISKEEFENIVKNNNVVNRVNYSNVVNFDSPQENALKRAYENLKKADSLEKKELLKNFERFKTQNNDWLEPKALYRALREIRGTHDYNQWQDVDKNLFNEDVVKIADRNKRIAEIYKQKFFEIDFYKFKQFLADESLKESKQKLNSMGLKLNGDMICGFSYDEVWANPKAFKKDATIGWGLPALDFDNKEAEKLLRKKVNLYANRFDGFRVDASWTYISPDIKKLSGEISKPYYGDKVLKIIDDEVLKVKGKNYDLKNIMHEFVASAESFNIYDGQNLRPYIENRNKIYTSDWLSSDWGSNDAFKKRGWRGDSFVLGAVNHDSKNIEVNESQAKTLSEILKIPQKKLMNLNEFIKAKFAEPMSAFNNMIFFKDALALDGRFQENSDKVLDFAIKIPENYEDVYHKSLQKGRGFNPMDALEKSFVSQGLEKTEPELFKKIVKYRKILESPETQKWYKTKTAKIAIAAGILAIGGFMVLLNKKSELKSN